MYFDSYFIINFWVILYCVKKIIKKYWVMIEEFVNYRYMYVFRYVFRWFNSLYNEGCGL